ncbi:MAG: hypothetical protein IJT98_02030 [Prevotella sp.]|nr:hypothetical protein [Prevotella sp.]
MSKKFTSFLVLAAAFLLSTPTQAQIARRATRSDQLRANHALTVQETRAAKAAFEKANESVEGLAFRSAQDVAANATAIPSIESDRARKAADTAGPEYLVLRWNWAAQATPHYFADMVNNTPLRPINETHRTRGAFAQALGANISVNGPRRVVTKNDNGIITAVDGTAKYYTRTGTAYYANSNQVYSAAQSGNVTIVEAEDGKLYIKDIVSRYSQSTYVEATRDGDIITVAGGQPVQYNTTYSTTLGVYWGNYDESSQNVWNKVAGDITFQVDDAAGTISLIGSNEDLYIGIFWDDDDSFAGYGDYETVWTLDEDYTPPSEDLVELPAGAEVQTWYREQNNATSSGSTAVTGDAKVAFVGSDVYVAGVFTQFPDAWIKGTIEGTTVTFAGGQFVGYYGGTTPIWAFGTDESVLEDFTMTYDADAQSLISDNELLANAAVDRIYYLQWIEGLALYAEQPAPAAIDELPYSNDFADAALQRHFTAIDANADGKTWGAGTENFTISYASPNDDWLVSPAIKLVAGKKYHFAIDTWARSGSYPETFEVKIAAEATAEALAAGAVVIEQQTVNVTAAVTVETEELTVEADGYYYIGIHNTSNDQWAQYVDNFVIEAAPLTAPVTLDLTQEGAIDYFGVIDNNGDQKTWSWSSENGVYYSYSSTLAADDYLVLPIKLEAGKGYNVVVTAAAAASSYPEKFEVKVGKAASVEGLNITAIAETLVNVTADTEYDGSFTTDEAGTYYVAIHATSDADQYQLRVKKLVIEAGAEGDAPAAVDNFAVTPLDDVLGATITFTAPTKNLAGEDLAADGITKIDILRNGAVINTIEAPAPGAELSYVDQDEALTIGNYKYQVITYGESGIGGKSEEISVFLTATLTVPYTADFTVAGTFDAFQVINNNDDSSTWLWSASYGAYYNYSSTNQGDDYLVTSPIRLEAGKNYKVIVNANAYSASYPERFEVVVGKEATAAGLNITAIAATDVTSVDAEDFEGDFTATEDGIYYVAIHAISDPDEWRLQVNSLSIEKGLEGTAPAAPVISAEAGAEGALTAAITVVAPATSIDGTDLPAANLTKVEILRDGEVIATETPAPGATINYTDNEVTTGNHTYQAIPYDANGDAGQKSEKVTVYVGEDELADVENVVATATATTITFTWDAATGLNGGYVNAANVTYEVYALEIEQSYFGSYLVEGEVVATVTGATTATINYDTNSGEQQYLYFGVKATNAVGSTDATTNYAYVFVGAPTDLPIIEGFAGSTLHYSWDTNGGLGISNDASDGDGMALKLYNDGTSADVYFYLPRVNLKSAANPTLLFDVRSEAVSQVFAIGSADGAELDFIGSAHAVSAEYTSVKVPLASIIGNDYSAVGIFATIPTVSETQYEDTIIIDNIKIVDLLEYNLAVDVKAPANVQAGSNAAITVTVKNIGENAASNYTVKLTAGEETLLEETVADELASYEEKEFTAELATTIFTEAGDLDIVATVEYANDLDEDDNEASTVLTVKASAAAPVENLAADVDGNSVILTWTAPENTNTEVTDDFAAYENGADEDGELGDWTLINANGYTKGGIFEDISLASDGLERAWQVFNLATYGGDNSSFAGPDGEVDNNYLVSVYNLQDGGYPGNDDWLISPQLPGIAQTLTFDVKAFNDYGAQTYQVLYSTTGNAIEDFQLIEEVVDNGNAWNTVSYELPAGTTYFAIRNITGGDEGFILAIDNIKFLQGGGEISQYNIYVDEDLHDSSDETTYEVTGLEDGTHKFSVTAVYNSGAESAPVSVTVDDIATAIEQLIATGKAVNIYTTDGRLVRQNVTSTEGLKAGLYIVNGKKAVQK